jgi:hypothetical protein
MKKLLIISLISSSILLVWCFNNETKPDIINRVKENKEVESVQSWSVKSDSWVVEKN